MKPRIVGRLGLADAVTIANAAIGFFAVIAATIDPGLAARLVLLAAVADGLDGVIARHVGSTPAGKYLDSLADVSSFALAPAAIVFAIAYDAWGPWSDPLSVTALAAIGIPALFVAMAVARLGMYTAYDATDTRTLGTPTTLAATVLAAAVLAGHGDPAILMVGAAAFCYLMVSSIEYPDLLARDALLMGVVHGLAVIAPEFYGRTFPYALLTLALAYLLFAPWFYWGETERRAGDVDDPRADVTENT